MSDRDENDDRRCDDCGAPAALCDCHLQWCWCPGCGVFHASVGCSCPVRIADYDDANDTVL